MTAAWTQVFEQGAVEGIGFNFNSGDGGDLAVAGIDGQPTVAFPASDPWATAVGGTTLEIGRTGAVVGELGWGDTIAQENAAGTAYVEAPPGVFTEGSTGGRSGLFAEPAYQAASCRPRCRPMTAPSPPGVKSPTSPPTPAPSPAG